MVEGPKARLATWKKSPPGLGGLFIEVFPISARRDGRDRRGPNRARNASDDQHRSSTRDIPSSNVLVRHSGRGGGSPPRGYARRDDGPPHPIVTRPFRRDAGICHDRRPHGFVELRSETKHPPRPLPTSLSRESKTLCVVRSKYASCNREVRDVATFGQNKDPASGESRSIISPGAGPAPLRLLSPYCDRLWIGNTEKHVESLEKRGIGVSWRVRPSALKSPPAGWGKTEQLWGYSTCARSRRQYPLRNKRAARRRLS